MLYYTSPANADIRAAIDAGLLGSFDSPVASPRSYRSSAWCADNGCFHANYCGDEQYLLWLEAAQPDRTRCAFATAPDVVADAAATLDRSLPMFAPIRDLGFPVALVAQNGLEDIPVPWDSFDALFIGGNVSWKLGPEAAALAHEAKAQGKHLHMGRVNTFRRLQYAFDIGCDSVDGSTLAVAPDKNLAQLLTWMADINGAHPECIICGRQFRPVNHGAKTCSDRCRKTLSRTRR